MKHVSREWLLAGDATFTIEVPAALVEHHDYRPHYTYRVQRVPAKGDYPESIFVKLLTGPDNTSSFTYLGKLDEFTGQVRTTAKSAKLDGTTPHKLLNRILARVWGGDHDAYESHGFRTHHEGRCGRCGRKLTTPESVERGIGPECWELLGNAARLAIAPDAVESDEQAARSGKFNVPADPDAYRDPAQDDDSSGEPSLVTAYWKRTGPRESASAVFASDLHLRAGQFPDTIETGDDVYVRGSEVYASDGELEAVLYASRVTKRTLTVHND